MIQQFETTDADMEDMSVENNLNVEMHWFRGQNVTYLINTTPSQFELLSQIKSQLTTY